MVVFIVLLEVDVTLGGSCGIWEIPAPFQASEMSTVIPRLYGCYAGANSRE